MVGSTARALLPASMAGLPGKRAMVWVGPPLFCSRGPSPGSATPTWLPLVPLARPPEPPVPIRLYALAEETVPPSAEMSLAGACRCRWCSARRSCCRAWPCLERAPLNPFRARRRCRPSC